MSNPSINIVHVTRKVHLLALLIQQVKESDCFLTDQLNAASVISVADVLPGDSLCHIIFLEHI